MKILTYLKIIIHTHESLTKPKANEFRIAHAQDEQNVVYILIISLNQIYVVERGTFNL